MEGPFLVSFSYTLAHPSTPLYSGAVAIIDVPETVVGLAGVDYPIDLENFTHRGLPSFRDGVVTSREPNDQLFDSQGAWWRYRFSFHHGAGQAVVDLEDDNDSARFLASRGIDPWTKYQACLLPDTTQVKAAAIDGIIMGATATHLYVRTAAQTVERSADLSTWNAVTGMAAEDVVGITTDGTDAYIATTGHVYRVTPAGVGATSVNSGTPTNGLTSIAFVGNFLLVGDGNILADASTSPSAYTTVKTHFQTGFEWTCIFQVGSRIYAGGFSGNRSELYSATTTSDGSLVLAAEAASFFAGELLNTALSYGGAVVLATSKGIRFATLAADGTLQYGPLIDGPGDSTCLAAEGRFVWFGWETFPETGSGVGRLALDQFVDTLQPAYATDVFTEDDSTGVVAVARFANRTVFAVAGDGVYATVAGTWVAEGYIDLGELYFGTVEDKSVSETRARTGPLDAGEAVGLEIFDGETGESLASGTSSVANTVGVAVNADGEIVNWMTGRITLTGPGTSTPCLRQWRARAYPIGPPVEEWIVPLILHERDIVGSGQGQIRPYNPHTEVERIKTLWRSREVITFQIGAHAHRVRIDNFSWDPADWTDDSAWLEGTLTVRLLTA
jgi:hypothetical protein